MPLVYQLVTGHALPQHKKLFNCRCKAIDYLKDIFKTVEKKLTRNELELSIKLTRIDDDVCPRVKELFLERKGKIKTAA